MMGTTRKTLDSPPPKKKPEYSRGSECPNKSRSSPTGQAVSKLYRGRNVGKLANMFQMPLDIICEIATHLVPLDILHLARSSRSFNNLLMSRNSKSIWRVARANIAGLPDCPSDLSEPEYARLLFDKYCHACATRRASKVDYILRARFCKQCMNANVLKAASLLKMIPTLKAAHLDYVPCRKEVSRRGACSKYYNKVQAQALLAEFKSLIPEDVSDAQKYNLLKEFYHRRKQLVKEVEEHAENLERWIRSYLSAKKIEEANTVCRRETSLIAKLVELGYKTSDFPTQREDTEWKTWRKIIDQPQDLTSRSWTNLKPKLEECIKRVKEAREEAEREGRKSARRSELSPFIDSLITKRRRQDSRLSMRIDQAFCLPTVVALVKEDDFNKIITQERWDVVISQVENDIDEFADDSRNFFNGLIRASIPNSSSSASSVNHAPVAPVDGENDGHHEIVSLDSAYFRCCECPQAISLMKYPEAVDHSHSRKSMKFDATLNEYAKLLLPYLDRDKLNIESHFQCLRCDEDMAVPMDWYALIDHFRSEQKWYDKAVLRQKNSSGVMVTLYNDHDIHNQNPDTPTCCLLNSLTAWELIKRNDWMQRDDMYDARGQEHFWRCALCSLEFRGVFQKRIRSHIRRKHLKKPTSKDMIEVVSESGVFLE